MRHGDRRRKTARYRRIEKPLMAPFFAYYVALRLNFSIAFNSWGAMEHKIRLKAAVETL